MEENGLIIIIGTLFTLALILISSIVIVISQTRKTEALNKYQKLALTRQKEISENTLLSQERERQRVGLDLHDDLGPSFAAIRNNLTRVVSQLDQNNLIKARSISVETSGDLKNAMDRFADVSKILYPVILNRNGLEAAIKDLANKLEESGQTKITVKMSLFNTTKELTRLVLFRVTQELFTNAHKHAQAKQIELDISNKDKQIFLTYSDDGIGFDSAKEFEGLGLESIKGRIKALDGSVEFISDPSEGLTVKISIPNEENSNS
jgi:NarL family two-component system sensor histidine kinase LiaS